MEHPRLEDRVAVVTGASRGIGLAIAHRLAVDGALVVLTARKRDALDEAVASFAPGTAVAVAGRADDPDHLEEVIATARAHFSRLDMLVNNVGINPAFGPTLDIDLGAARKMVDVNVLSAVAWTRAALCAGLGFEHRGVVVNVSSVTGQMPSPDLGFYGVTKAALDHLTRTLAVELGPEVRVNAVAPAVIKTVFSRPLYEGKEEAVAAQYPMGRLGEPADVANLVAFLASDEAAWITGQVITVDGDCFRRAVWPERARAPAATRCDADCRTDRVRYRRRGWGA